jgi:hypothetical protein
MTKLTYVSHAMLLSGALQQIAQDYPEADLHFVLSNGETIVAHGDFAIQADTIRFIERTGRMHLLRIDHIVEVFCDEPISNKVGAGWDTATPAVDTFA